MICETDHHVYPDEKKCGQWLAQARQAAGFSIETVASMLHLSPHVITALEQENWCHLGALIYVRGQLRSYARLLGLDPKQVLQRADLPENEPPPLKSRTHISQARWLFDSVLRKALYIVITAAFAVPVWYATRSQLAVMRGSDPSGSPPAREPSAAMAVLPSLAQANSTVVTQTARPAPYVASILPMITPASPLSAPHPSSRLLPTLGADSAIDATVSPSAAPVIHDHFLSLVFIEDSWLQVFSPDGRPLEALLVRAGDHRDYALGEAGTIILGNAAGVQVRRQDQGIDLRPYCHANIARIRLNTEGLLLPAAD